VVLPRINQLQDHVFDLLAVVAHVDAGLADLESPEAVNHGRAAACSTNTDGAARKRSRSTYNDTSARSMQIARRWAGPANTLPDTGIAWGCHPDRRVTAKPCGRCAAVTRSFLPFTMTQPQARSADHPRAADLDEPRPDDPPCEQACEIRYRLSSGTMWMKLSPWSRYTRVDQSITHALRNRAYRSSLCGIFP
jgi:hypothetical protein